MVLNTEQMIEATSGKNKSFLKRVAKQQEDKYGNVDIFGATIRDENDIEVNFGENWIRFFFRNGEVYDKTGMGQGHKYEPSIKSVAEELRDKYVNGILGY